MLDKLQIYALEVEENFTFVGKSRGNIDPMEKNKGK